MFVNFFYCFYLKGRVADIIRNPIKKSAQTDGKSDLAAPTGRLSNFTAARL